MAIGDFPLLFFPTPSSAERNKLGGGGGTFSVPEIARQRLRIQPQLKVLKKAFDDQRVSIQQDAPLADPELVLVLEIAGTIDDFSKAVKRIAGFEWLSEWADDQFAQDSDFYLESKPDKLLDRRLFLVASNRSAVAQLFSLWARYRKNPAIKFGRGLAKFRALFAQLRTIRPWDVSDRIDSDLRQYWQERVDDGPQDIRFELEAWHYASSEKNEASRAEIEALVQQLGGRILRRALMDEIAYHGFLVEISAQAVVAILDGEFPRLMLSNRIMYFRPKAQSMTGGIDPGDDNSSLTPEQSDAELPPVIALLDGLPLQNHALLQGKLQIDDPDEWEETYLAKDRVHGTAMASLILFGELDGGAKPLKRRLYVRPVMRPDQLDGINTRRQERTPDDALLIDLMHRAVKRICEGEGNEPPAAPTVRVINLSIGDEARLFERQMSPWARLLDWLSFKYSVLFVVSAGNDSRALKLAIPRDDLDSLTSEKRSALAFTAMISEPETRRLLAPAEAMNVLTVGALYADQSTVPVVPGRFDLFKQGELSPLSRIGLGFRRAIKPEVLMPGGRLLYRAKMQTASDASVVDVLVNSGAPGHLVAVPPLPNESLSKTGYSRGTSNSAALTSRAAAQIYDALELLRAETSNALGREYDAVLLKALLVHGAGWGDLPSKLLAERPDFNLIKGPAKGIAEKDFVARWLGYGFVDVDRAMSCASGRATLLGVGELGDGDALIFSAPLPPSLAGKTAWRRLTMTIAWISPIDCSHQGYRRAKLWTTPPDKQLRVNRTNSVDFRAALRGTVQHEILEGEDAVAFIDGDRLECKVNCAADAGELIGKVRFAICVSLEVAADSNIPIYQEISDRIKPLIVIQPVVG